MQQIKLSIQEDQAIFLNDHERQGFKDKSAMKKGDSSRIAAASAA
jgi:hypothetical protein